jgi:hypothetical protein
VREARSEGLRLSKGAQAGVPVPLDAAAILELRRPPTGGGVKMTPVPQVGGAVGVRNEEAKEYVGLCTAGLWPAFLNLGFARTAKTRSKVKGAGRRPAVRTAQTKERCHGVCQESGECRVIARAQATLSRTACWRGLCYCKASHHSPLATHHFLRRRQYGVQASSRIQPRASRRRPKRRAIGGGSQAWASSKPRDSRSRAPASCIARMRA